MNSAKFVVRDSVGKELAVVDFTPVATGSLSINSWYGTTNHPVGEETTVVVVTLPKTKETDLDYEPTEEEKSRLVVSQAVGQRPVTEANYPGADIPTTGSPIIGDRSVIGRPEEPSIGAPETDNVEPPADERPTGRVEDDEVVKTGEVGATLQREYTPTKSVEEQNKETPAVDETGTPVEQNPDNRELNLS